ncbi:CRISPR-associated CARF protein Csx1 [Acidianus infernus]|uniref:CRISPR-associated CARF protein Csx1 n=1 Tax=Acidianus infernus TaxID=12915 RepID=UPI001F0E3D12|nr:CRISPR-associated CARF protein Csx1 [Acidianus infernus]
MNILFAPIGDPTNYDEVTYIVDKEDGGQVSEFTNASFIAISKALNLNKDEIIVYAGLSLCDNSCTDLNCCRNSIRKKVSNKLGNNFKLLISPNIYGTRFTQKDRRNTLYFNFVYFNSLKILEDKKPDKVYIDITHGINHMPLLATDAIKLATYTYMIEKDKEGVELKVYNSEPVVKGNKGPYKIDAIYSEKLTTRQAILSIISPFLSKEGKNVIKNKVFKEIGDSSCNPDFVYHVVNALSGGIFLYLLLSKDKIDACLEAVENKLQKLDSENLNINITFDKGNVIYDESMHIEVSYLHSLLMISKHIAEGNNTLKNIRRMAEKYSTSDSVKYLILNEINNIENIVKKIGGIEKPMILAEVMKKAKEEDEKRLKYVALIRGTYTPTEALRKT